MGRQTVKSRFRDAILYLQLPYEIIASDLNISTDGLCQILKHGGIPSKSLISSLCRRYPIFSFDYITNNKGNLIMPNKATVQNQSGINKRFMEAFNHIGESTYSLSKKLQINQKSIWNYANNVTTPAPKVITSLCSIYKDISYDYIINGVGALLKNDNKENLELVNNIDIEKDQINCTGSLSIEERVKDMQLERIQLYQDTIKALKGEVEALWKLNSNLQEYKRSLLEMVKSNNK